MKNLFVRKLTVFTFLTLCLACTRLTALDYIDTYHSISSSFKSFTDPNEGLTSFPSLNIPSGGRDESLGSAFTGLCDDICFFDYNPAASCVLKNTEIAVFHNAWISDSNLESIAGTVRCGNLGLGAKLKCFYVPFSEYNIFGSRVAGNYYSETTGILNVSYNFMEGYYFKGLAAGLNLKGGWRSIPDYTDNETDALIAGSGLAQSSAAVMCDAGILLRFNVLKNYASRDPNLKVGLSILNAGVAFTGFGSSKGTVLDDPLPTAVSLGVSYRFIKPLALTAEFRQPVNLMAFDKSALFSAGMGLDIIITDYMEIMAGFRLKGANPRFSLGSEFKVRKLTIDVNYTFDLTSSLNPVNHFSLSARINLGDRGRLAKKTKADEYYARGLNEYSKGNLEAAVAYWQSALDYDKTFEPARNWIKAVKNMQTLFERAKEIQNINRQE